VPGVRFGRGGVNTNLLESYLGPLPPHWWQQSDLSPYVRDGDERVQSRNIIFRESLPKILDMLPDDDARRQALACLVDTQNHLRVHQSMLLALLGELGYPPGFDAASWWQRHASLFIRECDAPAAARRTFGWREKAENVADVGDHFDALHSQLSAARYQEQGQWGGHADFGEAYREVEYMPRTAASLPLAAPNNVAWWPEPPPRRPPFVGARISP
jgi:hypothetical protein